MVLSSLRLADTLGCDVSCIAVLTFYRVRRHATRGDVLEERGSVTHVKVNVC
jgi:uncharacterized Fe-S cluster-containing radical SAM superfamily protein